MVRSALAAVAVALVLSGGVAHAQALPTQAERDAADVTSYLTLAANLGLAVADCRHDGQWDRVCLIRLAVKNGAGLAISEGLKRVIHEPRPCEPASCGRDAGTGSRPSGHSLISFVNVDPFGRAHLGVTVEYSFASVTAAARVLAWKHRARNVAESAAIGQALNAATHALIH